MSEKGEVLRDGARAQKNSGRGKHQKADARLEPFVYDIKEYDKSFGLSRSVWAKVCTDAAISRGEPALKIVLGEGHSKIRLWVMSDEMFHQMRDAWLEKYNEQ